MVPEVTLEEGIVDFETPVEFLEDGVELSLEPSPPHAGGLAPLHFFLLRRFASTRRGRPQIWDIQTAGLKA